MSALADLVMPKLGLTMTEGRIASWNLAPGEPFAAGDVLVVVETDKIANEVEAPAAGTLVEILAADDTIVPVGAPIARWQPSDSAVVQAAMAGARPAPAATPDVPAPPAFPAAVASRTAGDRRVDERLLATPYARRLARAAGLDLAGLPGSGPRGRIKAADVEAALAARLAGPAQAEQAAAPVPAGSMGAMPARVAGTARPVSFAVAEIEAGPLAGFLADLHHAGHARITRRHLIALACVRLRAAGGRPVVRLACDDEAGRALIEADAAISLSDLADRFDHAVGDGGEVPSGGDIAIHVAPDGLRFFGPAPAPGWTMALGLAQAPAGPDAARAGTIGAILSYDSEALDHAAAARFLGDLKALIEAPLRLLVG
jgi:pyruvate dehydrogenase E2 component (dihydrolipoamide acetyltransferase)